MMRIALINENSQANKNAIILRELEDVATPLGHSVVNVGMFSAEDEPLTYVQNGILAAILLNTKAVDFVITGCGTGEGALLALNSFPGVICGYVVEPSDAYLFLQINNGNALSIPYAKGFGWGADVNLKNIFNIAFGSPKGMGYPNEPGRKESQNRNAAKLVEVKAAVAKPLVEALSAMDQDIVKKSLTPRFLECFFEGCKDEELRKFVEGLL